MANTRYIVSYLMLVLTSLASFSPLSHAVSFLGGAIGSEMGCVLSAISSS